MGEDSGIDGKKYLLVNLKKSKTLVLLVDPVRTTKRRGGIIKEKISTIHHPIELVAKGQKKQGKRKKGKKIMK